ncbi:Hypothetical predicted protein [Marmota monax]|uniref:Uncharacterized protein n=1 Tax=Marmota monax TaxID=9995 RepID=A0A5E4CUF8_MARMO|nr:hypothetical protein GHT09_015285 [Marmota monax]VTJ84582.1 Hypothetical predicted protein [Marmota monax]
MPFPRSSTGQRPTDSQAHRKPLLAQAVLLLTPNPLCVLTSSSGPGRAGTPSCAGQGEHTGPPLHLLSALSSMEGVRGVKWHRETLDSQYLRMETALTPREASVVLATTMPGAVCSQLVPVWAKETLDSH